MSGVINTGGPAFPHDDRAQYGERSGMTLRDYFAAHEPIDPNESIGLALAERLAGRPSPKATPTDKPGTGTMKSADPVEMALFWADAEAAYRYLRADAMLRARERGAV